MAKAVAIESEHNKKLSVTKHTARVNMAAECSGSEESEAPKSEKVIPQKGGMWAALEAVQADLALIKDAMAQSKAPPPVGPRRNASQGYGCAACREKGLGDQCDLCFICRDPTISLVVVIHKSGEPGKRERWLPPQRDCE